MKNYQNFVYAILLFAMLFTINACAKGSTSEDTSSQNTDPIITDEQKLDDESYATEPKIKKYKNTEYGFELQYPEQLFAKEFPTQIVFEKFAMTDDYELVASPPLFVNFGNADGGIEDYEKTLMTDTNKEVSYLQIGERNFLKGRYQNEMDEGYISSYTIIIDSVVITFVHNENLLEEDVVLEIIKTFTK